jgi:MinD-like ATPase involved in chromosome partitioning or flagellar assembly
MVGKVITFYSYKGGVGRSMALANVSVILAKWDYKVLVIDWDLEAPGLENYYGKITNAAAIKNKDGLIDLLGKKIANPDDSIDKMIWKDHCTTINLGNNCTLDILSAGRRDEQYVNKVRQFDFNDFYQKADGMQYLEDLRDLWIEKYDFILIDSRTGLTDSSGICSIHMPDILALLFTPNEQSFNGIKDVSKRAIEGQKKMVFDRFRLRTLPIVTRIENAETNLMDEWIGRIARESEDMLEWLPRDIEKIPFGNKRTANTRPEYIFTPLQLINSLKIFYKTLYSYGESLPAYERGTSDPTDLGYVYETIAAALANDLQDIHLLDGSRDTYVKKAKREDPEVADPIKNSKANASVNDELLASEEKFRRTRKRYIYTGILVLFIVMLIVLFYKRYVDSAAELQEKTTDSLSKTTDSLSTVVDVYNLRTTADSLIKVKDSSKADYYSTKAADAALSIKDTMQAIKILKEVTRSYETVKSEDKLESLLMTRYGNAYKIDIFFRDPDLSNKKGLDPMKIANIVADELGKDAKTVPRMRSVSEKKQLGLEYYGERNEVRYDQNDKEEKAFAGRIAKQLNAIPQFRDNKITFVEIPVRIPSAGYISIFIQN